jgi:hypothetical protein
VWHIELRRVAVATDLLDGLFADHCVQPLLQKYSGFQKSQITLYQRHPVPLGAGLSREKSRIGEP